jgi:hypothetical protein
VEDGMGLRVPGHGNPLTSQDCRPVIFSSSFAQPTIHVSSDYAA